MPGGSAASSRSTACATPAPLDSAEVSGYLSALANRGVAASTRTPGAKRVAFPLHPGSRPAPARTKRLSARGQATAAAGGAVARRSGGAARLPAGRDLADGVAALRRRSAGWKRGVASEGRALRPRRSAGARRQGRQGPSECCRASVRRPRARKTGCPREWAWNGCFPPRDTTSIPVPASAAAITCTSRLAEGGERRRARGWYPPHGVMPHPAPLVRHAPAREWLRHPHHPGTARTSRREHDDDLYPCPESGRLRGQKSA